MSDYVADDETKKAFLEAWATGLTRPKIAMQFDRTASWVQWMTEVTGAPPRRVTVHNYKRVSGQEPDKRLERRAYHRAANELKLGLINLRYRLHEVRRLQADCALSQTPLVENPYLSRKRITLKSGLATVAKRVAKLRALARSDPLLAEANSVLAEGRTVFDSLPYKRKKSPRK